MAQKASRKTVQKFKQDIDFLESKGISKETIALRMKMAPENFSTYNTESLAITNQFLGRFYDAWEDELEPDTDKDLAKDISERYRIHDTIVEKLVDGQNRLIDGQNKLIDSNTLLVDKNAALVEYNHKLVDLLIRQGIKPDSPGLPIEGS